MAEKILDFGVFGKWSEATLKIQCSTRLRVNTIENTYTKRKEDFEESIKCYGKKRVKKLTIEEVSAYIRWYSDE